MKWHPLSKTLKRILCKGVTCMSKCFTGAGLNCICMWYSFLFNYFKELKEKDVFLIVHMIVNWSKYKFEYN